MAMVARTYNWLSRRDGWTLAGVALFTLLAAVLSTAAAFAQQQPSYYNYSFSLVAQLATSASDAADPVLRFPVNALNLTDRGFLAADGQDLLIQRNSAKAPSFVHLGANPSSWWVAFDGTTVTPGGFISAVAYTGETTTAADNPQGLSLNVTSTTEDMTFTLPSSTIRRASIALDDFQVDSYPENNMSIIATGGGMQGGLTTTGSLSMGFISGGTGAHQCIVATAPLTLGQAYDIVGNFIVSTSNECWLTVDGASVSDDTAVSGSLIAVGSGRYGGALGYQGSVGNLSISVSDDEGTPPSLANDYQFEAAHLTETQEGTSGNGWAWQGTIETQAGSNDATYTFVRDMSDWTFSVANIVPLTVFSAGTSEESFEDPLEDAQGDDPFDDSFTGGSYLFPFSVFEGFVGGPGQITDSLFSGIVGLFISLLALTGTYQVTKVWGFALIGASIGASVTVLMTPLYPATIVLIVIGVFVALMLIPEPWEAR